MPHMMPWNRLYNVVPHQSLWDIQLHWQLMLHDLSLLCLYNRSRSRYVQVVTNSKVPFQFLALVYVQECTSLNPQHLLLSKVPVDIQKRWYPSSEQGERIHLCHEIRQQCVAFHFWLNAMHVGWYGHRLPLPLYISLVFQQNCHPWHPYIWHYQMHLKRNLRRHGPSKDFLFHVSLPACEVTSGVLVYCCWTTRIWPSLQVNAVS